MRPWAESFGILDYADLIERDLTSLVQMLQVQELPGRDHIGARVQTGLASGSPLVPWATIEIVEHCGNEVLHAEATELCATAVGHLARGKVDQMSKTGRVAVITGAAQGIGKRTAELLADRQKCNSPCDIIRGDLLH
jgi:hypothetical protein